MDNARGQQEESSRFMQQTAPGTAAPSYAAPASPPSATTGGGGRSVAQGAAERRYALSGHGYFVAIVPRDWQEQVR